MTLLIVGCKDQDNSLSSEENLDNVNATQRIVDSEFKNIIETNNLISKRTIYNNTMNISSDWIVKANPVDDLSIITTKLENGLKLELDYNERGYVYIRQIIGDIYNFENKQIQLKINYTYEEDKPLNYDIYIQSRFNQDNTTRIRVTDTNSDKILKGNHTIIKEFQVPKFDNYGIIDIDSTEGLSTAFRLIGVDEHINITIHSFELNIIN